MVALTVRSRSSAFASPTEPFWVYTKLAMYGALLVASPFIFWELWKLHRASLYKKEKAHGAGADPGHAGCFLAARVFGYRVLSTPH